MNDRSQLQEALKKIIVNKKEYDIKESVSWEYVEKTLAGHIGFKREKDRFKDYVYFYDKARGDFRPVREVICYSGAPGTGKTSFVNTIKEVTGRKIERITCAGLKEDKNYSILGDDGKPSLVAWVMKEKECKNPIILFDELEKVADEKIQEDLIKLFGMYNNENKDKSQVFHDKYYDLDIELDHITFFATVNYPEQLAPLLKKAIKMRRLDDYDEEDKKKILRLKKEQIEKRLQQLYPGEDTEIISEELINQIVGGYIQESGIRQSERVLFKIEKDYINAQNSQEKFSIGNPREWLKKNVLPYRESFKPDWKHYSLFGVWGVSWIFLLVVIVKKVILKNEKQPEALEEN